MNTDKIEQGFSPVIVVRGFILANSEPKGSHYMC